MPEIHTYLVVADDTPEFDAALRYAATRAGATGGAIAILRVIDIKDFQDWAAVEARIREELRQRAEKKLWEIGVTITDTYGLRPEFCITEGNIHDGIIKTISDYPEIFQLVLGAPQPGAASPHSLIHYFTGKGLARLKIPLVIVPPNLDLGRTQDMS